MAYIAKDDILIYLENVVTVGQGLSTNIKLTFYKDFVGKQLDIRRTGTLRISLFNSAGKRLLTYNYPNEYAEPISISTLDETKGEATFTISQFYSSNLELGDLYAEVEFVDTKNFFPSTRRYLFAQFKIGEVVATGVPALQSSVAGDILVSTFNIISVSGANPTAVGKASVNSTNPALTTSVIFNNLNENNIRLTSLENFLSQRFSSPGQKATITIINTLSPTQYAIYDIVSWQRVNLNSNGSSADYSDAIKLTLDFESVSSSDIIENLEWEIGQRISYQLEAYTEVGDLVTDISELRFDISTKGTEIDTVENSVDSMETQISAVQTSVNNVQQTVSSVQQTVSSVESNLISQISSLTASISALASLTATIPVEGNLAPNVIPYTERNLIPNLTILSATIQGTGLGLAEDPAPTTYVEVNVNGVINDVGNGTKNGYACFFSGDGGTTAKTYAELDEGDQLYWNAGVAGYFLEDSDRIDFNYQIHR